MKRWWRFVGMGLVLGLAYWFKRTIVAFARDHTLYLLIGVAVLIVAILLFLYFFFRSARKKPEADAKPEKPDSEDEEDDEQAEEEVKDAPEAAVKVAAYRKLSSLRLRKICTRAMKRMKTNVPGKNYRYQIPWIMMLGEAGAGKTSSLEQAGFKMPLGGPVGGRPGERDECKWWFFEKGIVIDVSGDLVLQEDGFSSNEKLWRLFLRLLQKHRPERPIDGVVLAVPCADLIGKDSGDKADLDEASRKADLLSKKLMDAQKVLGIRFPVYVLVTGCDRIEGFKSYCQNIPEKLADNMFGWSSPHSVDTGYSGEWVKRAFNSINQDLFQTQFELFTEKSRLRDPDGFYLLPENLKKLAPPLQIYLDRVFRQSVYHDSYMFRGLYFCGDSGIDEIKNVPKTVYFLRELFSRKIFSEFRLARPVTKTLISKNRAVIATQVIALVLALTCSLGLWFASNRLKSDKRAMLPVFEQIDEDFRKFRKEDAGPEGLALYRALHHESMSNTFEESAQNLFKGMTNFRSLTYAFIPSSWFSDLHMELKRSMTLAYHEIILKALYIELLQKAKNIFEAQTGAQYDNGDSSEILAVDELPEFKRLENFINSLKELEKNANLYNGLSASKNLEDLGQVVKYLFDLELPSEFYKNARYYHHALGKSQYRVFDPSIFKLKAKFFTLKKLTKRLYSRLYNPNRLEISVQRLAFKMDQFARQRRSPTGELKLIKGVLESMSRSEEDLAREEFAWVFKEEFDLGDAFNDILTSIEESNFLGEDLRQEVYAEGEAGFIKLREALRGKHSILTGPLLATTADQGIIGDAVDALKSAVIEPAVDNEAFFADFESEDIADINEKDAEITLEEEDADEEEDEDLAADEDEEGDEDKTPGLFNRLSPTVLALKNEFKQLLGQDFMGEELARKKGLELPPGTRLRWDQNLLKEALKMFEPYETYSQEGLQHFPVELQSSMANLARDNLEKKVMDLVARAQQFETIPVDYNGQLPETDILLEIRDFNRSSNILNRLLGNLNGLNLVRSYQVLSDILYWQTATLLEAFNSFLEEEDLYGVRGGDLSWWNGRQPVSFDAFDVQDEKDLKNYLRFQRKRIKYLAEEYARPLVTFFKNSHILRNREEERILFKWERILVELDKYENKKPKNSITVLEKYILAGMNSVDAENYYRKITEEMLRAQSGDIFLQRRNDLRRLLFDQCQVIASRNVEINYRALKTFFDEKLAGKFPFADITPGLSGYEEADPEQIRDFYLFYDKTVPTISSVLKFNNNFGLSGQYAARFIEKMEKVREFFGLYLDEPDEKKEKEKDKEADKTKEKVPVLGLKVAFRVNQGHEVMANQIIRWKLVVGKQTFTNNGKKTTGQWLFGEPVAISLRWAKNAPYKPVFAGEFEDAAISGRTATWRFTNSWSLLRLLVEHAADQADFDRFKDTEPHTLKFEVDVDRADGKDPAGKKFKSRAFARIELTTADKEKKALRMPEFPRSAPKLGMLNAVKGD